MSKKFDIHEWQAKTKLAEQNMTNFGPVRSVTKYNGLPIRDNVMDYANEILNQINDYENNVGPGEQMIDYNATREAARALMNAVDKDEEGMMEISTTGTGASFQAGAGEAYATPYAFKKKRKDRMDEVSYRDFKRNTESTPRQKIAKGISQVGRMIKEIEKIVNHNFRLKTELDMNSGTFMKSTNKRIHELGAQLKRLENKLREFSN